MMAGQDDTEGSTGGHDRGDQDSRPGCATGGGRT